tara:strand:- start:24992 stop:26392 length:1401 start_codon:yes stop_codon:yes gene_type:complete
MQFPISRIINASVNQPGQGVGEYNTSNVALFSLDEPAEAFEYKIVTDPLLVASDFGSSSITTRMAQVGYAQQPNINANRGYTVEIPMIIQELSIDFSPSPVSGNFRFTYDGNESDDIAFDATTLEIQTELRTLSGLESAVLTGDVASGLVVKMYGNYLPSALTITSNTMVDGLSDPSVGTVTEDVAAETLTEAITRTMGLVQYFGIIPCFEVEDAEMQSAGTLVQSLNKMIFFLGSSASDVEEGGKIDKLRTASLDQSRGLLYTDADGLLFVAGYVYRFLSVNFNGQNTTLTMHLKDLSGVQPDSGIDNTILQNAQDSGADVYISFEGVPKVYTSGANDFADNVYNLQWFIGALKVAGFNYLATVGTKIPQTDDGILGLNSAYDEVCERAGQNQFIAPGSWTSGITFGNQQDFLQNISQRGYFIYSQPVAQQSVAARQARQAPVTQLAIKYAGAVHSSDIIVNINE